MRNITLGHLKINSRAERYILDIIANSRLSRGKYTERFENEFAALHDCNHAIFMNSGTSALQVALAALKEVHGYKDGDEVLVPATTFIATSNIVLQNNMRPVFVDVEQSTSNIDVEKIEAQITSRTRCIIPVHIFGLPVDMEPLMAIARKHGLQVIEDSCETMFAESDGRRVGSFGDLACFSTYVAHLIVGGVGGIVTTNDDHLAMLCRSLMAHGRNSIYLSIDDDNVHGNNLQNIIERRYSFERIGYSYRPTELEAAIALSELENWEENISTRRRNAALLTLFLDPLRQWLQLPIVPVNRTHSFMMYPIVLQPGVDRDKLLLYLEENGVETRYLLPLLSQPIYQKLFPGLDNQYPIAQHLAQRGFIVGMHQGLSDLDIANLANLFLAYFGKGL
jgi:perosamine synthetase